MLSVVLVAPSIVDTAVPSTNPRVSAGDVDPEPATAVSLGAETTSLEVSVASEEASSTEPGAGSPAVDVIGSVTVASPDDAEACAGEEVASAEEGAASVLVFDEAGSVATAVASEAVLAGWSTTGAASVADVVGSVGEAVVAVATSEVSCVAVLAVSTVVSTLAGASTGSMSSVGSLKVGPPGSHTLHTLPCQGAALFCTSCFPRFEGRQSKLCPDLF
jgi:hypothetical protein